MLKVPGMKIGCEHDELRGPQHGGSCALVKIDMRKVSTDSGDGGCSQGRGKGGFAATEGAKGWFHRDDEGLASLVLILPARALG